MALPYHIMQKYEELVSLLQDAAAASNCGDVVYVQSPLNCFSNSFDKNIFDCTFYLKDWKSRSMSICLLLHVQEIISKTEDDFLLEKSTIRISYFKVDGEKAYCMHSMHFDYGPPQAGHPIFHAQLVQNPVRLTEEERREVGFEFEIEPNSSVFEFARLPTSDMTLPSVFLCLAADHINPLLFNDLFSKIKELQDQMPKPIFTKTMDSMRASSTHLRSSHWYAHCV